MSKHYHRAPSEYIGLLDTAGGVLARRSAGTTGIDGRGDLLPRLGRRCQRVVYVCRPLRFARSIMGSRRLAAD
jgi:hypothetical protein